MNWITCGNALRLDWLKVCPPEGTGVKLHSDDLFQTPLDQPQIDFENEGGETYICGNPPYLGSTWQSEEQKEELRELFDSRARNWRSLDYVAGWFMKAGDYGTGTKGASAFVTTNSICQGQQVAILWPMIFETGAGINFAYPSLRWANLASHNAGVTVSIVGLTSKNDLRKHLFVVEAGEATTDRTVDHINPYLIAGPNVIVQKNAVPINGLQEMVRGNIAADGGGLLMTRTEALRLELSNSFRQLVIRRIYGSDEYINGTERYCLWINDNQIAQAKASPAICSRLDSVRNARMASTRAGTRALASTPYRFAEVRQRGDESIIVVPAISSENRDYLPVGVIAPGAIISGKNFGLYDAPLWNMALIASRLHWVWIGAVCIRMRTDFSYSNTLGWNTFPVPSLTDQNKADLTGCAEGILLAREAHFPATIADLYDPDTMPANLRAAHEANDEVLERIYIGRRFRNDTERLEKLFEMYAKITVTGAGNKQRKTPSRTTKVKTRAEVQA